MPRFAQHSRIRARAGKRDELIASPRLPVWEDANDRGFIARHHAPGRGALVSVSAAGTEHLHKHRRQPPR